MGKNFQKRKLYIKKQNEILEYIKPNWIGNRKFKWKRISAPYWVLKYSKFEWIWISILIDGIGFKSNSKTNKIELFRDVESPKEVELITVKKIKSATYQLSLNFKNNSWIDAPKWNSHKICD
jgi:hypothetical protein